jgi:AcrR family transcriptional regulator
VAAGGINLKRYYPGITDKRLNNRRFYRTEEAILRAFFGDEYLSAREVARRAGIARTTFYHHHQSVAKIVADYQKYIINKYKRLVKKMLSAQKTPVRIMYERTLLFIVQHKRIFKILLMKRELSVLKYMISKMQLRLVEAMRLPKNSARIFLVYEGEVVSLIDAWCRNGMKEDEINQLLDEIMFLTETARVRLKVLL